MVNAYDPSLKINQYYPVNPAEQKLQQLAHRDIASGTLEGHHALTWSTAQGRAAVEAFQVEHTEFKQLSDIRGLAINLDTLFKRSDVSLDLKVAIAHDYSLIFAQTAVGPLLVRSVGQAGAYSFSRQAENHAVMSNPAITQIQEIWLNNDKTLGTAPPQDKWPAHYAMKAKWLAQAIGNYRASTVEIDSTSSMQRMELLQQLANAYNVVNSRENVSHVEGGEVLPARELFTERELAPLKDNLALREVFARLRIQALKSEDLEALGIPVENWEHFANDMEALITQNREWNPLARNPWHHYAQIKDAMPESSPAAITSCSYNPELADYIKAQERQKDAPGDLSGFASKVASQSPVWAR